MKISNPLGTNEIEAVITEYSGKLKLWYNTFNMIN